MEEKYVRDTYDNIAEDFSRTRSRAWPEIVEYLKNIETPSTILEVGCGNGKNFCDPRHTYYGIDISKNLLKCVPKEHQSRVIVGNALELPYESASFHHVMSIAVIHHLSTFESRRKALMEMIRVTQTGGSLLFSMWAFDENDKKRDASEKMVPFRKRNGDTFYRYYVLTKEDEFKQLVESIDDLVEIERVWYSNQNYFCLMKK